MPPFPEHCSFLSVESKALMLARIKADGGHVVDDQVNFKKVLHYLLDWKLIAGIIMYLGVLENANSLANFQPTIIKGLGYTATQAQVHTIPVYLAGTSFVIIFAFMSEWLQRRYVFYMLGWVVLVVGIAVELTYPANAKVRYMGVFFIGGGCWLGMPVSLIWVTLNSGRGYKRAVRIAAIVNFGTAGAFISSNVFLFKETPRFHTGFSSNMGMACVGAFCATMLWFAFRYENKKRDLRRAEMPAVPGQSMEELGDEHPDFRYVY